MICPEYAKLDRMAEKDFISDLLHVVKADDEIFVLAELLIKQGRRKGLFDKVVFRPDLVGKPDINTDPQKDI